MAADKKCPSCGACQECGAHPQIVPMPSRTYPYAPWSQPYPNTWTYPRPYWQTVQCGSGYQRTVNTASGNYQ